MLSFKGSAAALGLAVLAAACAHSDSIADIADATTKGVYNVDIDATEAHMDDELRAQVTRASVGALSDKMHALGDYKGVKQTSADPDKGLYAFEATFDRGSLAVTVRMDPAGKLGAYRVSPAAH